jgi:hypothetical protein
MRAESGNSLRGEDSLFDRVRQTVRCRLRLWLQTPWRLSDASDKPATMGLHSAKKVNTTRDGKPPRELR